MKYRVTIDGEAREVDVSVAPDGRATIALDGVSRPDVDVVRVPGGVSLRIDGRVYDIATGGPPAATQVTAGSARAVVEVTSARMRARGKSNSALGSGGKDIKAPMPGRVVKILVAVGQSVEAGEPCIVIEAMKMENELRAPSSGTVAEILVKEGVSVEGRALLVRFG